MHSTNANDKYDLYYVTHWSLHSEKCLLYSIQIINTFPVTIKNVNHNMKYLGQHWKIIFYVTSSTLQKNPLQLKIIKYLEYFCKQLYQLWSYICIGILL